jgi:nitronate monooxygenase
VPRLDLATLPVLAAPMAGGPSTPGLVAAAAHAGSLGFVPGGYLTVDQFAADLASVRAETDRYGVNLFVPDPMPVDRAGVLAYRELISPEFDRLGLELPAPRWVDDDEWPAKVDLLVRDPAPWVSFTFGLPGPEPMARLRRAGSRLLITVTDVEEARAAADTSPDGLIVQSADGGGHRGTLDPHRTPGNQPLDELVRAVVDVTGLPVIAAGGIADSRQAAHLLTAGAEAVQVGTALLLADEAGTRPVHRRALADPASTTVTMRAFTGRVARGIRNSFSDRYDAHAPVGYPAVHHLTAPMRRWAAAHDDPDHLHLWAGTGHRLARPGPTGVLIAGLLP